MGQEEQDQRIDYGPQYTAFSDGRLSGGFREAAETSAGGPLVVLYAKDLKTAQQRIVANGVELAVWSER